MQDFSTVRSAGGGNAAEQKLTDVIKRLSAVGFTDIFNEEQQVSPKLPIVKIGAEQYRVLDVEDSRDDLSKPLDSKKDQDIFLREAKTVKSTAQDDTHTHEDSSFSNKDSEKSQPVLSQGVHPGIVIFLSPVNPKDFLEKLPVSLRSFVENTVKIVKQKLNDDVMQYRFSFSELKLDILFENGQDGLTIRILSKESETKKSLLNKENQGLLFSALQQEFPDDKVHVLFDDAQTEQRGFSQQQQQSQQDGQQENGENEPN